MTQSHPGSDATELQHQVDVLKKQLAQAQKLTALGELLGTTTHEFNNILMTILNYAKMGLRHRDDATRDKALQKILAASQRASKITNTVLGVARNRAKGFESTDLASLVDDSLMLLEREMNKYRIMVEKRIDAVPPVHADGNQIQQVLLNMLINARQAMRDGGTILIKLAHDADRKTVDLMVRDSGKGIPQDQLKSIFDPYFTTKDGPDESGRGGTGLGLSACRDIIEAHRGRIRVESTVGTGTAFTIKLPVAQVQPAAPVITAPNSASAFSSPNAPRTPNQ